MDTTRRSCAGPRWITPSPPAGICTRACAKGEWRQSVHARGGGEPLSTLGRRYLAGSSQHARAAAVFTTPTINGYKRYRSYSLAPDRAIWGCDNRGVMVRVLGGRGTRRRGWRTAPASPSPTRTSTWPRRSTRASTASSGLIPDRLPTRPTRPRRRSSRRACARRSRARRRSVLPHRARLAFVDYYVRIKKAEIERFQAEITDWEQRDRTRPPGTSAARCDSRCSSCAPTRRSRGSAPRRASAGSRRWAS